MREEGERERGVVGYSRWWCTKNLGVWPADGGKQITRACGCGCVCVCGSRNGIISVCCLIFCVRESKGSYSGVRRTGLFALASEIRKTRAKRPSGHFKMKIKENERFIYGGLSAQSIQDSDFPLTIETIQREKI